MNFLGTRFPARVRKKKQKQKQTTTEKISTHTQKYLCPPGGGGYPLTNTSGISNGERWKKKAFYKHDERGFVET